MRRGENRSTRRKASRRRVENQQTQPTYDAESGNRTRDTLVDGERSHHCANPTNQNLPEVMVDMVRHADKISKFQIFTFFQVDFPGFFGSVSSVHSVNQDFRIRFHSERFSLLSVSFSEVSKPKFSSFQLQKKKDMPTAQQRRKHQITYLAFQVSHLSSNNIKVDWLHK